MRPVLRGQKADGSEEEITENELFNYTRYRWLCDEPRNLARRYRKFNLSALIDAAISAASNDATSCTKILKCTEGQHNKTLVLTMDDGVEIVARIPNPNAGPAFYTVASEVATRRFAHTFLNLPIPRIYAYSLDSMNPVGVEYILEEKAKGKPLGSLWYRWAKESQVGLIAQLVDFETKMRSITFRKHGCIYFKEDLEERGLPIHELEAEISSSPDFRKSLDPALTGKFVLGPLTDARLWEEERASLELDRGPWTNSSSFMAAMGINEIRWTKEFAKPQINPYQSLETPVAPDEYVSLLERYLQLVPYLSPGPFRTSLSHPDLHLDNIFVNPDTEKITCIIDWQSASISEPFLQHHTPRMLLSAGSRPSTRNTHDPSRETHKLPSSNADLLDIYQNLTRLRDEQHWAAKNIHNRLLLTEPVSQLCGSWSRGDVFSFRHALIRIVACWSQIASATVACPVQFTDGELHIHESEMETLEGLGEVLHQLQSDGLIPLGGMVLREDYEDALHVNDAVRRAFIDLAESDSQRALHSRIWPYQDHKL